MQPVSRYPLMALVLFEQIDFYSVSFTPGDPIAPQMRNSNIIISRSHWNGDSLDLQASSIEEDCLSAH